MSRIEDDAYYYARDHERGPGAWCVRGPDGFQMTVPGLDKSVAYIIGKLLSGQYGDAHELCEVLATREIFGEAAMTPREAKRVLGDRIALHGLNLFLSLASPELLAKMGSIVSLSFPSAPERGDTMEDNPLETNRQTEVH